MIGSVTRRMDRAEGYPLALHDRAVANSGQPIARGAIVPLPRHLEHFDFSQAFPHLLHAADVIDMGVGQHDSIQSRGTAKLFERSDQKLAPNRDSLPGVEQNRMLARSDQIGVGSR